MKGGARKGDIIQIKAMLSHGLAPIEVSKSLGIVLSCVESFVEKPKRRRKVQKEENSALKTGDFT